MPTLTLLSPLRRIALAACTVALIAGCKEFTSIDASFANVTADNSIYAINGSPPGAPTAIGLFTGGIFRADQSFGYDIAFDIDDQGRALVIPVRALSAGFSDPLSIGLQTVPGEFVLLTEAPTEGYRVDTTLVVAKGGVVALEMHDQNSCGFAIKGQTYFAKMLITEIDVAKRKIDITLTVNRNCGFRSFAVGIPSF